MHDQQPGERGKERRSFPSCVAGCVRAQKGMGEGAENEGNLTGALRFSATSCVTRTLLQESHAWICSPLRK